MSPSTALPAIALLVSFPWFGLKSTSKAPADSIPTPWKPASVLALENRFVMPTLPTLGPTETSFRVSYDPRRLRVAVQPDSGTISYGTSFGEVDLGSRSRLSLDRYARLMSEETFERQWRDRARQGINQRAGSGNRPAGSQGGLSFEFPSPLPKRVQSLLGPGGPALRVSGSENIRISGQSNWTNQQVVPLGQKRSLFPSLDMQQDLDLRLEGQLSDRIKVNMLQNSATQIPLANRIAINYRGDEDDLIQQLDLGNTNLSLPGTQYVSYSGKNEGLFGAKVTTRVGPLDFTMLASKQEGRSERASYAGGSVKQKQTLRDLDYVQGTYFLLYDPNAGTSYSIPDTSIRIYLDDTNVSNDVNTIRGRALVDATRLAEADAADSALTFGGGPVSVRGEFSLLNPGADQDYEILPEVYGSLYKVIRLRNPVRSEQVLAATYARGPTGGPYQQVGGEDIDLGNDVKERVLQLLRPPASLVKADPNGSGLIDTTLAIYRVRDFELRNFYNLPGQRIDPGTFDLTIRLGVDDPPITFVSVDGVAVPYIEVLGLDNFDESTGTPLTGHDQRVDGSARSSQTTAFVDYENGILFLPDLRPFAPRLGRPFESAIDDELNRRARLVGDQGDRNVPNALVYDKHNIQRDTDARYYIDVEFTAARATGEIILGRGNILEGSEVVTISGETLIRDRDYTIDYDLGRVTLRRQLGPSDNLNIDYSYAPLFQQAGRTLLGSAFRFEGRERSFGGAFMYESKGAQDLRPRLGEEPSRSLISDVNTDWTFHPGFLTRLVDQLPGVRTTQPSELRVQAEVGASFPNPNTQNEVYIDDMEGVRDAVSLSMSADRWRLSSPPSLVTTRNGQNVGTSKRLDLVQQDQEGRHNSELHWYTPYSVVKERELKPTLTDGQGAQNIRSVLALSMPRRPAGAQPDDKLWGGLTYVLDRNGLDLSQAQFIEVWVNDFRDRHNPSIQQDRIRGVHALLRLDLGVVSEDQMRAPNIYPNGQLDSEDKDPRDQQLDVTEGRNEDTGYDGLLDQAEGGGAVPDLSTVTADDPEGDNFGQPSDSYKEIDPRRFVTINGTEKNKQIYPYPDTEDLNLNNNPDTNEEYLEWTIDLGDTASPYLVTDVYEEYVGKNVPNPVNADNGWRRYRIPINDPAGTKFGSPQLNLARHVRLWIDSLQVTNVEPYGNNEQRPLLLIGSIDIVGSRWRAADLDSASLLRGTTVTLNSVNSVDNADIYAPPFDPGQTRSGAEELTRREQSIALEFTDLPAQSKVEAFKTFSLDEDYTRYGTLGWYARGFKPAGASIDPASGLMYFVRFASDEQGRNYYEYRAPLATAWSEVRLPLAEMSGLKLDTGYSSTSDTAFSRPRDSDPSVLLLVKGRPSFTRIRRVSVGVVNLPPDSVTTYDAAQLWFNELRALDVARDIGTAQRLQANGRIADLVTYNMGWNGRDADFLTVGESRGRGSGTSQFNAGATFALHKFFEATRIVMPLTFGYTQSGTNPRFSAGDDIVREGAAAEASKSYSDGRSWSIAYSREWGQRSNPFLRYTVGGITANMGIGNTHSRNPNSISRGKSMSAAVNYSIAPRSLLPIPMPLMKGKLYPFPERFFWNYSVNRQQSQSYDRDPVTGSLVPRAPVDGRSATVQFGADSRPFDAFNHRFDATRNLTLESPQHFGFINLGRVVRWGQSMGTAYTLNRGAWLRPSLRWSSQYTQNNGPELSRDLSIKSIGNGQTFNLGYELPFNTLTRPAQRDSSGVTGSALWRSFLARIGKVNTNGTVNYSSRYSRLTGIPGFMYFVGGTQDPGFSGPTRVSEQPGNQSTKTFDWRTNASTRLDVGFGAGIQTTVEVSSSITDANGVNRRRDTARYPDITLDYGRLTNVLRLDKFLNNARLRTAYNRSQTTNYNNSKTIKSDIATSSQWQPLMSVTGDLKNGTRLEFRIERRNTEREAFQLGRSVTKDRNTDVNLNLSRSFTKGQKVKLLGKETTVRSSVTMGLSAVYSVRQGETVDQSGRSRNPVHSDRLSVNANGSYGFSSNVTGNLTIGFAQERDIIREIIRRNLRLELRGAFTF